MVAGHLALASFRPGLDRFWGDESTFVAMAESLAADRDLRFDRTDGERLAARGGGRETLILQRTASGVFYSKPVLYPLLGAPFALLAGVNGLLFVNLAAMAAAAALGWTFLRRLGPPELATATLAAYLGIGAVLPYLCWRMTEAFQVALAMAAMALCFGADLPAPPRPGFLQRTLSWRGAPLAGAFLLGLLASMRYPNLALAAAPVLAALLRRSPRRACATALAAATGLATATALTFLLAGAANPYRAERSTFDAATGYPTTVDAPAARQWREAPATNRTELTPARVDLRSAYATLYFFVGRHTGLLLYFPCALIVGLMALRSRLEPRSLALLLTAAVLVAFYLLYQPRNYFGGSTFVGNRYFLPAYAALFAALPRLPRGRTLAAAAAWGCVLLASALASVATTGPLDPTSQSHAHAGVFRLAPYESTAAVLDGREDRYWSMDFVRFVDPFAEVDPWRFALRAGDPAAEALVADFAAAGPLQLLVATAAPEVELTVGDWRGRRRYRLGPEPGGIHHILAVEPHRAWRRHRFWWDPELLYWVRSVRWSVRTPGSREPVFLYHLGDGRIAEESFDRQLLDLELPTSAPAGSTALARVKLRNLSAWPWRREAVLPVRLSYRMWQRGNRRREIIEGPHVALAEDVPPGAVVEAELPIEWPAEPGSYRLVVDLVLEQVAWFRERVGRPLTAAWVEARPEVTEDAAAPPATGPGPDREGSAAAPPEALR